MQIERLCKFKEDLKVKIKNELEFIKVGINFCNVINFSNEYFKVFGCDCNKIVIQQKIEFGNKFDYCYDIVFKYFEQRNFIEYLYFFCVL